MYEYEIHFKPLTNEPINLDSEIVEGENIQSITKEIKRIEKCNYIVAIINLSKSVRTKI